MERSIGMRRYRIDQCSMYHGVNSLMRRMMRYVRRSMDTLCIVKQHRLIRLSHHVMPKAYRISMTVLCFWEKNCHGNFDSGMISWEYIFDSKEGDLIKEKLLTVLPMVSPDEQKHKLYDKLIKLVYEK